MLLRNWELKLVAFILALALWGWVLVNQRTVASARAVPVAVRTVGTLPQGYRITSIEVTPPVVTIGGPEQTVADLPFLSTQELPLGRLTGDTVDRLGVIAPKGTRLLRDTDVRVTVRVTRVDGGR